MRHANLVSPELFILVVEYVMKMVAEQIGKGTQYVIGRRPLLNIRYADDTTLLGRNREDLSKMAEGLKEESLKFDLEINNNKTKVMKLHGKGDFTIH